MNLICYGYYVYDDEFGSAYWHKMHSRGDSRTGYTGAIRRVHESHMSEARCSFGQYNHTNEIVMVNMLINRTMQPI